MMLGRHKRVLAPPELHLLRYSDFATWRQAYPHAMASLGWLMAQLGLPDTPAAVERRFAGLPVEAVYQDLLANCVPGAILVDKTPAYARDDEVLARAERLGPRYLWLVRHPLGVAASLMERYVKDSKAAHRWAAPWRLSSYRGATKAERLADRWRRERFSASLDYWRDAHGRIACLLGGLDPRRSAKVHYEELVHDPERVMDELCRWLGIEPTPAMLKPWEDLPDSLGWRVGDGKLLGTRSIERDRARAWRREFDEGELDAPTRELMERLGVGAATETGKRGALEGAPLG
jgi:hypothetical protein